MLLMIGGVIITGGGLVYGKVNHETFEEKDIENSGRGGGEQH